LGAFGIVCYGSKLSAKRDELVQLMQKFMPRSRFVIFSERLHPIHPIGPLNSCFGAFHNARVRLGMFFNGSKLVAKRAEVEQLMQKFVP
jgi:hypothetical protein